MHTSIRKTGLIGGLLIAFLGSMSCHSTRTAKENGMASDDQKGTETIVGPYWKLIELNGKQVKPGSTQKEPYIRLNDEENRVEANGGCNGMGGTYELEAPNRIRFSALMGTMMACENMEIENGMRRVLEATDSYHLQHDTLQLFRARMAPLAKFVAVDTK